MILFFKILTVFLFLIPSSIVFSDNSVNILACINISKDKIDKNEGITRKNLAELISEQESYKINNSPIGQEKDLIEEIRDRSWNRDFLLTPDCYENIWEAFIAREDSPCLDWDDCHPFKGQTLLDFRVNSARFKYTEMQFRKDLTLYDEVPLRFDYSFRFMIFDEDCTRIKDEETRISGSYFKCLLEKTNFQNTSENVSFLKRLVPDEVYFAYTGQFDFYMGTRPSGPVINRVSNPGLYAQWNIPKKFSYYKKDKIIIAIEHRSDGQVVEQESNDGGTPILSGDELNQELDQKNHRAFDTLSQGANYFSGSYHYTGRQNHELIAGLKIYIPGDTGGINTWEEKPTDFADYDIFTLSGRRYSRSGFSSLDAGYRIGALGFEGDSFDISVTASSCIFSLPLPLSIASHIGPMDYLSHYSVSTRSVSLGFNFSAINKLHSCNNWFSLKL